MIKLETSVSFVITVGDYGRRSLFEVSGWLRVVGISFNRITGPYIGCVLVTGWLDRWLSDCSASRSTGRLVAFWSLGNLLCVVIIIMDLWFRFLFVFINSIFSQLQWERMCVCECVWCESLWPPKWVLFHSHCLCYDYGGIDLLV